MKKIFYILVIFIISISRLNAKELYNYSQWFDYYPSDVEEYRIESEERYLWYREYTKDGKVIKDTTSEYYKSKEGYTKIEESKKMFYRVNNGPIIIIQESDRKILYDASLCIKNPCIYKYVKPYVTNGNESFSTENPKTGDNIYFYIILLLVSLFFIVKNNLVLSKRCK